MYLFIAFKILNSLSDSHCLRYKHQRPFKMLKLYIVRPLCTGKPIAWFHCRPNRTRHRRHGGASQQGASRSYL